MLKKQLAPVVAIGLVLTALISGCSQAAPPTPTPTPPPTTRANPAPRTNPTDTANPVPRQSPEPRPTSTPTPTVQTTPLAVTSTSLGNGSVGVAYSQTLQASGGKGGYTWTISGGALPTGLTFNGGVISGKPTASGPSSFTVQVTDSTGATATANLSITIQRVNPIITTTTIPGGKVGTAYSQTLAASDGVAPYTWAVTSGALPGGLTLNAAVISGTPTASGAFTFTVQVTDSAGSSATANLSLNIISVPVISTTTLPPGEVNIAYSQTLVVSGGTGPYTWSMSASALPGGLTFNAGVLSGTPTASGTFPVTFQVTDSIGSITTANLTLNIMAPPTITTTTLPSGKVGLAYSQTLAVSAGISPYTWSVTSGSLPGGLALNAGAVSGTPTTTGTFSFTVQAADAAGVPAKANFLITITLAPTIFTTTLPSGEVGLPYSQAMAASGGLLPYTWSISSGTLPTGLTTSAGVISGTPTASGVFSFTVQVTDNTGATATANLSINVTTPPLISTTTLPGGTHGTAYSQTLAASGGVTPYAWSISSGALPAGLTLSAGGVISGTPTTAGTSNFAVQVSDGAGAVITANLALTIN